MMIALDEMDYRNDRGNEYYTGVLENGDILQLMKYGYYGDDRPWEWQVRLPDDIHCYTSNYREHVFPTAEEALEDFHSCYEGRNWLSLAEQREKYGPEYYRCIECGWEGESGEIGSKIVYEDYGDVSCSVCPGCGCVEYDGMELLVRV